MCEHENSRRPLPEWILECYEFVCSRWEDADGYQNAPHLSWEEAIDILTEADMNEVCREDAEYALTRLHDRGYFYVVDDEIRVTTPSEITG